VDGAGGILRGRCDRVLRRAGDAQSSLGFTLNLPHVLLVVFSLSPHRLTLALLRALWITYASLLRLASVLYYATRLATERHGSCGLDEYWLAAVHAAHDRRTLPFSGSLYTVRSDDALDDVSVSHVLDGNVVARDYEWAETSAMCLERHWAT
jgi:hypothetical protein